MTGSPYTATGATNMLAALLEARTGQQIASDRSWRIETALKALMRERSFDRLDDLVAALLAGRDPALADAAVDALLNHETSFFRDGPVLEITVDALEAARAAGQGARTRIWSVGCSSGQEPLSLAMLLEDRAGFAPFPEIVATEVSDLAIARARAGRFSQFEIQRGLPVRQMMRWFDQVGEDWVARPELLRRIMFRRHNLAADPLPAGRFDAILCRNVLLYFTPALRRQVLDRLAGAMRPGGLLVLGAGETVIGHTQGFAPCDRFRGLYRATGAVERSAAVG